MKKLLKYILLDYTRIKDKWYIKNTLPNLKCKRVNLVGIDLFMKAFNRTSAAIDHFQVIFTDKGMYIALSCSANHSLKYSMYKFYFL